MNEVVMNEIQDKTRIAARICRACGKTSTAMKWIASSCQGKNILFFSNSPVNMNDALNNIMINSDDEQISSTRRDEIVFSNGCSITFVNKNNLSRNAIIGKVFDGLVIDDFGELDIEDIAIAFERVRMDDESPLFITYNKITKEMKDILNRLDSVSPFYKVTFDFLDGMQHGLLHSEELRYAMEVLKEKEFKEQYGPYGKSDEKDNTNSMFSFLLRRP